MSIAVSVIEARDLVSKDSNGFSDPYCVLTVGKKKQKTKVVEKTLNPKWGQTFMVDISTMTSLLFELYDKDRLTKDEFLGLVLVDLKGVKFDTPTPTWYKLHPRAGKNEKVTGELLLNFSPMQSDTALKSGDLPKSVVAELRQMVEGKLTRRDPVLDLNGCGLNRIPRFIREKNFWTSLDLSFNVIDLFPEGIWNFTNLEYLNLSANQLGKLAPSFTLLSKLREFRVYGNTVQFLPPDISKLTNLAILDASNNQLKQLPSEIGHLTKLEELIVYGNPLGRLPTEISRCVSIEVMDISSCELTMLPDSFGNMTRIIELNMATNKLTDLPPSIGQMTRLAKLNVSDNLLRDLPVECGKLDALQSFFIERNQIPEECDLMQYYLLGMDKFFFYLQKRYKDWATENLKPPSMERQASVKLPSTVSASLLPLAAPLKPDEDREIQAGELEQKILKLKLMSNQMISDCKAMLQIILDRVNKSPDFDDMSRVLAAITSMKEYDDANKPEMDKAKQVISAYDIPRYFPIHVLNDDTMQLKKEALTLVSDYEWSLNGVVKSFRYGNIQMKDLTSLLRLVKGMKAILEGIALPPMTQTS